MTNKPVFVDINFIDMIPFFMSLLEGVSIEESMTVFDLVMFVDEFKQVFITEGKPEHLLKAKKYFSEPTKQVLIEIYNSLEMYEHSQALIDN